MQLPKRLIRNFILFVVLFVGFSVFTSIYPSFLWFDSFGYSHVWTFVLLSKIKIFFVFFVGALLFLGINVRLAQKNLNRTRQFGDLRFRTPFAVVNQFLESLAKRSSENSVSVSTSIQSVFMFVIAGFVSLIFGMIIQVRGISQFGP